MNVYEAAMKRIEFLFDEFEQIIISFSGGKDSGVMMNIVLNYATKPTSFIALAFTTWITKRSTRPPLTMLPKLSEIFLPK